MTYDFLQNKYTKMYFGLVQKRKDNPIHKSDEYCETHHIIPRSLGGSDEKENLVNLTPREHFIAHRLLTKMTMGRDNRSMWWALHRTLFSGKVKIHSAREYEKIKKHWVDWLKQNHPSVTVPGWCEKMSQIIKRDWENNDKKRKKVSEAFKKSHRERREKNPIEYYENQRKNSNKGAYSIRKKWEEDFEWARQEKLKMSERSSGPKNPMFGKSRSVEQKKRQSEAISRKRWVSNKTETLYVDVELVEYYTNKGYIMGRKKKGESLDG